MKKPDCHRHVVMGFAVSAYFLLTLLFSPPVQSQSTEDMIADIGMERQRIYSALDSYFEKNVRWDAGTSYWNSTNYTGYLDDAGQVVLLKFSHGEEGYWSNYEYVFRHGEIAFMAIHSGEPDGAEKWEAIYFRNREIIHAYLKQKPAGEPLSLDALPEQSHYEIMNHLSDFTQSFLSGVETELRHFHEALNQLPESIVSLLNPGSTVVAQVAADINGDAVDEYIVAIGLNQQDPEWNEIRDRKLFIFVKHDDGYVIHSTNNLVLMCSTCGGVMGDPWAGIKTGNKSFEISHLGGSRGRWFVSYKFGYSRTYDQWQLVAVHQGSYDSLDETGKTVSETYTPPKDFGLINFVDFDPDHYLGQGIK